MSEAQYADIMIELANIEWIQGVTLDLLAAGLPGRSRVVEEYRQKLQRLADDIRKRAEAFTQLTDSDADSAPHSDPLSAPHSDTDSGRYKIR